MMQALSVVEPIARFVVATLLNGVWEDVLVAFVAWLLLRSLPNLNATTRYAVWCSALVTAVLLPPATTLPLVTTQVSTAAYQSRVTQTNSAASSTHAAAAGSREHTAARGERVPPARSAGSWFPERMHITLPAWIAAIVFAVWGIVALVFLARLIAALAHLERLKSDALPLAVDYRDDLARWRSAAKGARDVRLCVSDRTEVPVAVGLFDAMILVPKHLLATLSQSEIDQIALHELAHLRRGDDWSNGFQRVVQALLFFNPGIAYIARQLDLEREVACDDWVLAFTGDVRPYATCLTKMAEVTAWPHRAVAAPGVFITRKSVSIRVERLLRRGRDIRTRISPPVAGGVVVAMVVSFFVLQTVTPSFAFTLPALAQTAPPRPVLAHVPPATKHVVRVEPPGSATSLRVQPTASVALQPAPDASSSAMAEPAHAVTHVKMRVAQNEQIVVPPVHVHIPPRTIHVPAVNVDVAGFTVPMPKVSAADWGDNAASIACSGCDLHGVAWVGADLSGKNLAGINLSNARLEGVDFTRANLSHANLSGGKFVGVDFTGANLRGARVDGAAFTGCDFTGADLTGVDFTKAKLVGVDLGKSGRTKPPHSTR